MLSLFIEYTIVRHKSHLAQKNLPKVGKLKEWLAIDENRKAIPSDLLLVIINELDTNMVAVKASGVFPITYSLAASVSLIHVLTHL